MLVGRIPQTLYNIHTSHSSITGIFLLSHGENVMNLVKFRPTQLSVFPAYRRSIIQSFILLITVVAFLTGPSLTAGAQGQIFSNEPVWWSGVSSWTWSVALGDIDNDGDLDLVTGTINEDTGLVNMLYLNDGGVLASMPCWQSALANVTLSVSLGDVDNDGDLDLVCGYYDHATALYLNHNGVLETEPSWTSNASGFTTSIEMGDVDNDGDLDLVCGSGYGSGDQRNALYRNDGGVFTASPVWQSDSSYETTDVALGDINGDGYLDLVCGNRKAPNTLYLNEGGVFSTAPDWTADSLSNTLAVALGDVNGDGRLDLVCGNSENEFTGQRNTLFLNNGNLFSSVPDWQSNYQSVTWDIALGDIDGDGDLDLVCSRWEESVSNGNTAYLNNNGTLETLPSWVAGSMIGCMAIALGDIDGDGALDMVCGNYGADAVYSNHSSFLPREPNVTWGQSMGQTNAAYAVALGDIDGDDDVDVVVGNTTWSNRLYLNTAGVLDTMWAWASAPHNVTLSVALGDVDNDGDLDLACGNQDQNTIYLNNGATFQTDPYWTSGTYAASTYAIALCDMDLDGDLDLLCGNSEMSNGTANILYINDGGDVPGFTAEWFSGERRFTTGIAAGDIDGDGFPDLVCGNSGDDLYGEANSLYLNEGGVLFSNPVWSSGAMNATTSVALGDIDGDGDIDLVCGNASFDGSGQANTAYLNNGGTFSVTPGWISGFEDNTLAVALEDVDLDGDLDLVCGNSGLYPDGASNTIYLNTNGVFSAQPDWFSQTQKVTTGVALGDIDLDGDLDLVCATYAPGEELFLGTKNPVFKGDLISPTNQLPNNGAFSKYVSLHKIDDNSYRVIFTTYDCESDPVWIVPEYQFKGESTWYAADGAGTGFRWGPFQSSPSGVTDSLSWDITRIPFDQRNVMLRLRTVSVPRRVSLIQSVSSYLKDVGRLTPLRPEISLSTPVVSFPTVTVGDTSSAEIVVRNVGNLALSTSDIILPSTEMDVDRPAPFTLSPGQGDTLTLRLKPLQELNVAGVVEIRSNDPLSPSVAVQVTTDIRALDFNTKLLSQADTIPLADAVTVEITPAPQVHIEGGYLYHRAAGAPGGFTDSIPLSPSIDEFIAVIPGTFVTESGLEYYIKVINSEAFATDPPGAPGDSVFFQPVYSPTLLTTSLRYVRGENIRENDDIYIDAVLEDGAHFVDGQVHYRIGGQTEYWSDGPVTPGLPLFMIPGGRVGPRGIEYWVEATTTTQTLTDPPLDPAGSPKTVRVYDYDLSEAAAHPGGRYRMISIPIYLDVVQGIGLEAILSDQPEFGPYDPLQWRAFTYFPTLGRYVELGEAEEANHYFHPYPGRAYWLISKDDNKIGTAPLIGASTPTDSCYNVILYPGWNMIGNPFDFPVAWDSIRVGMEMYPVSMMDTLFEGPVRWTSGQDYEYDVDILEPFEGYWVKYLPGSAGSGGMWLRVPPQEAPVAPLMASAPVATHEENGWRISIAASCADAHDRSNFAGVVPGARNTWDRYDRSDPPMNPGAAISVYFPHSSWERNPGIYSSDLRGSCEQIDCAHVSAALPREVLWGHVWHFDVAKNFSTRTEGDQVTLTFDGMDAITAETQIYLVDRRLESVLNLRAGNEYRYLSGERAHVEDEEEARFVLLIGSEDFLEENGLPAPPVTTALHQNYPNPFNPATTIRYDIARAGMVSLKIYNARGSLVKILFEGYRDVNRYEIPWDGKNEENEDVVSGVYFCRLKAPGAIQTRKMILLK